MVNYSAVNRRDGALALEQELAKINDMFFARGLQMIVDGQESEDIREIMALEIQYLQERHSTGKKILGKHKSKKEAIGQEIAIRIAKAKRKK